MDKLSLMDNYIFFTLSCPVGLMVLLGWNKPTPITLQTGEDLVFPEKWLHKQEAQKDTIKRHMRINQAEDFHYAF